MLFIRGSYVRNGELSQFCFDDGSETRLYMVDIDGKIRATDFPKLAPQELGREILGHLGKRRLSIGIRRPR